MSNKKEFEKPLYSKTLKDPSDNKFYEYLVPEVEYEPYQKIDFQKTLLESLKNKNLWRGSYEEQFENSLNKNKKLYIEYLLDLECARELIEIEEQIMQNEDINNWLKNGENLANIRYALGRIQTYFMHKIYNKKR